MRAELYMRVGIFCRRSEADESAATRAKSAEMYLRKGGWKDSYTGAVAIRMAGDWNCGYRTDFDV